jgi:hypothetical protein
MVEGSDLLMKPDIGVFDGFDFLGHPGKDLMLLERGIKFHKVFLPLLFGMDLVLVF